MVNSINNIFSLLEDKEKSQFLKLVILMFLASIQETLGIASILPLINFLTDQEKSINFLENFFIDLTFFGNNYMIFLICIIFLV